MNVIVYHPPSPGCENSAKILAAAISASPAARDATVRILNLLPAPRPRLLETVPPLGDVDCAIFMERMIDHPSLLEARHRILVPNPEWLVPQTLNLASRCTEVWHKSHFSLDRLAPVLPAARHAYLGFGSADPGLRVQDHRDFLHLRGKIGTRRNTAAILSLWHSRRELPNLHVHLYADADGDSGLDYPGWLHDRNVHVRLGWLDRPDYWALATRHGVHLCTSEVEGFGHYIDEARALGSLVVTVDGAPMNELVDHGSGVLVRPRSTVPMRFGTRFQIGPDELAEAIDRVLGLGPEARRDLGNAARQRFEDEGQRFRSNANDLFTGLRG